MKDFKIEKGTIYILDRAYCATKARYSLLENDAFYEERIGKRKSIFIWGFCGEYIDGFFETLVGLYR